jgi:DNA-binding CsgD family transcriptional regulator
VRTALEDACAVLADEATAEQGYRVALAHRAGGTWRQARLSLAYGTWLRRQRRQVDARAPLRAARELFDSLGAQPWTDRASQELRATGETIPVRTGDRRDRLTAQEMQIAGMAARGLSNRDIGQRLFLSHRTVGSHLYRIFPKLGVTSRVELAQALPDAPGAE